MKRAKIGTLAALVGALAPASAQGQTAEIVANDSYRATDFVAAAPIIDGVNALLRNRTFHFETPSGEKNVSATLFNATTPAGNVETQYGNISNQIGLQYMQSGGDQLRPVIRGNGNIGPVKFAYLASSPLKAFDKPLTDLIAGTAVQLADNLYLAGGIERFDDFESDIHRTELNAGLRYHNLEAGVMHHRGNKSGNATAPYIAFKLR